MTSQNSSKLIIVKAQNNIEATAWSKNKIWYDKAAQSFLQNQWLRITIVKIVTEEQQMTQ